MARMIPPSCPSKSSRGERDLFYKLEKDPDTKGWVVFHSLDIKNHRSKIEGELDMVVLIPNHGILCIEVKGCDVKRVDGEWTYSYSTSNAKSLEGPFKQASKAMHSLRDYVRSKDSSLGNLLFFSCVIFTSIDFDQQSPEWLPWQFINARMFVRNTISNNLINIITRANQHILEKVGTHSWYNPKSSRPSIGQIEKITTILRDDFEYAISPRNQYEQTEQKILNFTEEQYEALDLLLDNDRVLFKGPAGTGKTFIALELAKRLSASGKKVIFICYNRLLGDWLKMQTNDAIFNRVKCTTFHSLLLEITKDKPAISASDEYWNYELPNKAFESLLDDNNQFPQHDFIVLDEAQDLVKEEFLDVLDLILDGGLTGGKWAFFGDFERQAIYIPDLKLGAEKALNNLKSRSPSYVTYSLRINCRNAEAIAETLTITSGLAPGYKRILNEIEDSEVCPAFYSTSAEQESHLSEAIAEARKIYKASEIVILSMNDDIKSCAKNLQKSNQNLEPIRSNKNINNIGFGSIHSFKGLEAPVVIITDIESLEDEMAKSLLYIGMSRAKIKLHMLIHEKCRSKYAELLDLGLALTAEKYNGY